VRVDEAEAAAGGDVLPDQRFEKGGLSGSGLADGIHMEESVRLPDTEEAARGPEVFAGKVADGGDVVWRHVHSISRLLRPDESGQIDAMARQRCIADTVDCIIRQTFPLWL